MGLSTCGPRSVRSVRQRSSQYRPKSPIYTYIMGLPIFGEGNNGTAQWFPDPCNQRGTANILPSRIITLVLSLYTLLHLNIPARNASFLNVLSWKAVWILFGLLAPEIVVFNSWRNGKLLLLSLRNLGERMVRNCQSLSFVGCLSR